MASGRISGAKGDIVTPKFLIECKFTDGKQYILKKDILRKISVEALQAGKSPALSLDIDGDKYVVVTREDFIEFL